MKILKKQIYSLLINFSFLLILLLSGTLIRAQAPVSKQVFDYTGADQVLTIPPCINQIKVKMWGGGGGGSAYNNQNAGGGAGGYVEGFFAVSQGDTYVIMVGEGGACDGTADNVSYGFGGGPYSSDQFGGYGGGLSGIFTDNTPVTAADFARAVLIAGGGGGGERASGDMVCTSGGQGGDTIFGGGMPDMKGDEGAPGIGGGGGGGYRGGLKTLRLSGNGTWYGGEGGLNYIAPTVSNGISLASADFGNWNTFPAMHKDPPNTADTDYTPFVSSASPGIGTGNMFTFTRAGHGRVVVEFYSSPIFASVDTLICEGNSATLSVTGGANYLWNTGTTAASIVVNPVTITTYTVTETTTGCVDSVTVSVNPKPVLTVNSENICPGETATLNASGAVTYLWSNGSTIDSISVSPATDVTYTVVGTTAGCSDTATSTVTLFTPPAVNAGANNDSLCPGETANLTVTPNGVGYSYAWAPAAGLNNTAIYNPVANPAMTTTYTVTVTDSNSCSNIDSVSVFVDMPMSATQSVNNVSCFGTCNGQATVNVNGGTTPYVYNWNGGCGNGTCSNLCAGTYTVTVTDAFGCSIISDTLITEPDTLVAAITTSSAATCADTCNGSATAIAIGGTAGGGYLYSWNTNPVQTGATATGLCAGIYSCTITDANNCSASTTVAITEPANMILITLVSPTACNSNTGMASVDVSGSGAGPYNYSWTPGGQTGSVATGLASGNYTVTVTDTNGCQASQLVEVTTADNPQAAASASVYTIFEGSNTLLSATGGTTFQWSPSGSLSCDTCAQPLATPLQTTTYCVTVTDTNSCADSACLTIVVEIPCPSDYKVPNAFSPNNDGHNDKFCLQGWSNCVNEFNIIIFDRWGEKVFESVDPGFCWDGTYKPVVKTSVQERMNAAVFVYHIEAVLADGTKLNRKGNISLLR